MDGSWKEKLIVAAIDFGTTHSGFVLSTRSDYEVYKEKKLIAKKWKSGEQVGTYKTPTCLLLKPDNTFHSFGYEAEKKYAQLAEEEDHKEWRFFRRFKMSLYKKRDVTTHNISSLSSVKDIQGRSFKALIVFSLSIDYMRRKIIELINERFPGLKEDDIHYVITIPAIWSEEAKLFMRKAALNARIPKERLRIALEPECAALYVQASQFAALDKMKTDEQILRPGTCHMVVDLGGGTVDIAVQRVNDECRFEAITPPDGDDWGSDAINMKYEQFLISLTGAPAFTKFRDENMEDYLYMQRQFELKKCEFADDDSDSNITFQLPLSLRELHIECNKESVFESIPQMPSSDDIKIKKDKMIMKANRFRQFFDDTIHGVLDTVNRAWSTVNEEVNTIICVGGFSDCKLLKDAFRVNFSHTHRMLIFPEEAVVSVMKGAIIYGWDQSVVNKRKCPYTYGLDWNEVFDPAQHDAKRREETDDGPVCRDIFKTLIVQGDEINYNEAPVEIDAYCKSKFQTVIEFPFYRSEILKRPKYIDDIGCCHIGTMSVDIGMSKSLERCVKLKIFFGETELRAEAEDYTRKQYKVKFILDDTE